MDDKVKAELSQKQHTPFHSRLLEHCKALVNMSRSDMSSYHNDWEDADMVYRGQRTRDKDDESANKKGAPSKIVVPLTYAQVQTFIAFVMSLYEQRDRFFELEGTGEEDHRAAKLGEALLDQNLEYNQFSLVLYQFLLNVGRFSLGVLKHSWVEKTERVWVEEEQPVRPGWGRPVAMLGSLFNPTPQMQKVQVPKDQIEYMGNEVTSISPFCFYPDTRFPLTRFQEGEFCASEEEVSMTSLRRGQKDGMYVGIEHIEPMRDETFRNRKGYKFAHFRTAGKDVRGQAESTVIRTTVQIELTPSQFKLSDGTTMGTSDVPEKWLVEIANDNRIIRAQPMGYAHNNFTYSVGQFSPDEKSLINETIADMVSHLQSVIDWLINSHITNVRKHISNRLVIDPAGIHFEDVRDHKPVIRLKPGAANTGVDRYVKQLNVSDVTRGHISDVQTLMQFVFMTTSISDNLMGQYHSGRRSAREAANTANASGQRLRTIAKLLYDGALKPMGKDMLSNLRDGLTEDMFVTVSGDAFPDWSAYKHFKLEDGRVKVAVNRTNLNGRFDFKVFEGILPSDKHMQAETLEQTLLALLKNPEGLAVLTQVLGYDPQKLFTEVLQLRGVKHPNRFKLDQARLMQFQQMQQSQMMLEQQTQQMSQNPYGNSNPGQPGPSGNVVPGSVQPAPDPFAGLVG